MTQRSKKTYIAKDGYKKSVLDYSVMEEGDGMTFIEIDLLTGRSHQIRVQFKQIGYPVIGDSKYGSKKTNIEIALWSYQMSFLHPTKREKVSFTCMPQKCAPWNSFSVLK